MLLLWLRYHGLPWPLDEEVRPRDLAWWLAALSIAWGAVRLAERPREGRVLATLGVLGVSALLVRELWSEPSVAFPLLIGATVLVVRIWPVAWSSEPHRGASPLPDLAWEARASAAVALGAWAMAVPSEWCARRSSALTLAAVIAVSAWFAGRWALADRAAGGRRWMAVAGGAVAGTTGLAFANQSPLVASAVLLLVPLGALVAAVPRRESGTAGVADLGSGLLDHPARFVVATFLALSVWGGAILALPACTRAGAPQVSFLDALFTAVSAACVTGLSVRDLSASFSFFGQLVVLGLIQAGAVGILVLSASTWTLLGQRLSVSQEALVLDGSGATGWDDLVPALRRVIGVTLAVEAGGALTLVYLLSVGGEPLAAAVWEGVFTSVSAYANAGFALHPDSMSRYADQPLILHTVALLSILGALGPLVVAAIPTWVTTRRASVQTRVIVWTTVALLVAPAAWIAILEGGRSLAGLSLPDLLTNAWFTSASLRTAGFASVDITGFHPATLLVMMGAMFIGGAPGSTAGGIKTTTFALLVLAVVAAVRGDRDASAFGRRFPAPTVYRATAVASLAVAVVFAALAALLVTQDVPLEVALFEVVSALATVGLSLGATAQVDEIGKFILVACMFVGRVGPLTLFLLLAEPRRGAATVVLPQQDVAVG